MPLVIGPTGMMGLVHGNGELHAARAAEAFGIPFCLSTVSICSIEDVREVTRRPLICVSSARWMRDRPGVLPVGSGRHSVTPVAFRVPPLAPAPRPSCARQCQSPSPAPYRSH